jgi:hypothetical protein
MKRSQKRLILFASLLTLLIFHYPGLSQSSETRCYGPERPCPEPKPREPFSISLVTSNGTLPAYCADGPTFVEVRRGENYRITIVNPTGSRVGVALTVDGLNTIDGQARNAWDSPKWLIEPYGTITVNGWQTGPSTARRFFFTSSGNSYASKRGYHEQIGAIQAVFFRESAPPFDPIIRPGSSDYPGEGTSPSVGKDKSGSAAPRATRGNEDERAGTGMGQRQDNEVRWLNVPLNPSPVGRIELLYEFARYRNGSDILPGKNRSKPIPPNSLATVDGYCPEP